MMKYFAEANLIILLKLRNVHSKGFDHIILVSDDEPSYLFLPSARITAVLVVINAHV